MQCTAVVSNVRIAHSCALLLDLVQELMIDPVIAADGFTYERHALQEWLRSRTTSPVTGNSLSSAIMVPNLAIMDILRSKK